MTPYEQWQRAKRQRDAIISENRARRMRAGEKQPPLPVPKLPPRPMWPVAYAADGTYEGVLSDPDDCPAGCVVRWEPAMR